MELGFLKPLFDRQGPWASVYIDTTRATEDAPAQQRLRERAVVNRLIDQGADARTVRAVRDTLAREPVEGAPPGRALFATAGEVVLDVPLSTPPPLEETAWSTLPHIAPLVNLRGEQPRCVVAYIDSTGADLEIRDTQGRRPTGRAEGHEWRARGHRSIPADRYEWRYRNRVEDTWRENAEIIAKEIARRWPEWDAELLILVGEPRHRSAVHDLLPEPIKKVTVEAENGSRAAGAFAEQLERELARIREEHHRKRLATALDLFWAGRGRPGEHGARGVDTGPGEAAEGIPAVVEALRSHQVATLLVAQGGADARRDVWVGQGCDQVAVQRSQAQALGVSKPERARADDALMRSAAAANAEVLVIPEGMQGPAGGLGAVLRWSP